MTTTPDLKKWTKYKHSENAKIEGVSYIGLSADFYELEHDGEMWSCGDFYTSDGSAVRAWGRSDSEHCSMHAIWTGTEWSEPIFSCPVARLVTDGLLELKSPNGSRAYLLDAPSTVES